MAKRICPISRAQFHANAPELLVTVGKEKFAAAPRQFSTGSLGWNLAGKTLVMIDGKPVEVSVNMNVTIPGSKELPADDATPAAAGE